MFDGRRVGGQMSNRQICEWTQEPDAKIESSVLVGRQNNEILLMMKN